MKYAIYSDVDGTIYGHARDGKIHEHNIEAIEKAKKLGVEFVIATGNGNFAIMQNLCARLGVRYLITSNGAGIYDFQKRDYIYKSYIPKAKAEKLVEIAMGLNSFAAGWNEQDFYITLDKVTPELKSLYAKVMLEHKEMMHIGEIESNLFKFEVYDTPEKVDQFIEAARDLDLQMARMKPGHVEITHEGVSKGEAVKTLNEILGVEKNDFMTIGDSANDHSMLLITDYAYAMANADDKTKKIAKLHTSSAEQGGLGEAIDDFLYRKRLDV